MYAIQKQKQKAKCARCRNHNVVSEIKNLHKFRCRYKDCECDKCKVTAKRRRLMAHQIAVRRQKRAEVNRCRLERNNFSGVEREFRPFPNVQQSQHLDAFQSHSGMRHPLVNICSYPITSHQQLAANRGVDQWVAALQSVAEAKKPITDDYNFKTHPKKQFKRRWSIDSMDSSVDTDTTVNQSNIFPPISMINSFSASLSSSLNHFHLALNKF